jgi:hypothetical protein
MLTSFELSLPFSTSCLFTLTFTSYGLKLTFLRHMWPYIYVFKSCEPTLRFFHIIFTATDPFHVDLSRHVCFNWPFSRFVSLLWNFPSHVSLHWNFSRHMGLNWDFYVMCAFADIFCLSEMLYHHYSMLVHRYIN